MVYSIHQRVTVGGVMFLGSYYIVYQYGNRLFFENYKVTSLENEKQKTFDFRNYILLLIEGKHSHNFYIHNNNNKL